MALQSVYTQRETEQMWYAIMEDVFNINKVQLMLDDDLQITDNQFDEVESIIMRLKAHEPLQYIAGRVGFKDISLSVGSSVLIPRPETEEMVSRIIGNWEGNPPGRIWDIGTGSGCIAIALAKAFPKAKVVASDISVEALAVARENAASNGVSIDFVHDDVLHSSSQVFDGQVDLVVSNPPYVLESERALMKPNVLNWEPETALFVPDDDPLVFYRAIIALASKHLSPDGLVWFEINESKGDEMKRLCHDYGFSDVVILRDFFGKPRFCVAKR